MKTRQIFYTTILMMICCTTRLSAWGPDIPIWTNGTVRCFDADYAIDGTMFVAFQPESETILYFYETRDRGYSWRELFHYDCYAPINKVKLVVDDDHNDLIVFYRYPLTDSYLGKLVCFRFDWADARTWSTLPAMVLHAVSSKPVIENSFDVCLRDDAYHAVWMEDVSSAAKLISVARATYSTLHLWDLVHTQNVVWSDGCGTRVTVANRPDKSVQFAYSCHPAEGYGVAIVSSPDGTTGWSAPEIYAHPTVRRYDARVCAANVNDRVIWIAYNGDRGDHEIGLYAICLTDHSLPTESLIADRGNIDEYIADIGNYRIYPNEWVNLLSIEDSEGAYRKLFWQWSSATDPLTWQGKVEVNDDDITSWPEDVAPKLVYSPGTWGGGGGAVFSYAGHDGLYFDAPWNVASGKLLIVSAHMLLESAFDLAEWKNSTGIKTYVVDLDTLRGGIDIAESIKYCIDRYYRNHGVRYVLLFGDSELMPTRYILMGYEQGQFYIKEYLNKSEWNWNWCDGGVYDQRMSTFLPNMFATDLYFADLYDGQGIFQTWDNNGNGFFGEIYRDIINAEGIEGLPDVAVGRVPASNTDEARIYVDKVKVYEVAAFQSDWFNRVCAIANEDWSSWISAANKTANTMTDAGFQVTFRTHPNDKNLDTLIHRVTGEGLGFLLYDGHGAWGMGGYSDWQVCNSMFPIVYHAGCGAGEFAPTNLPFKGYRAMDGVFYCAYDSMTSSVCTPHPRDCDGQPPYPDPLQPVARDGSYPEFLLCQHQDRGAIIYYGASTGMQSPGEDCGTWFFEAFTKGHRLAGDMWRYAVNTYCHEHNIWSITGDWVTDSSFPTTISVRGWWPPAQFHQIQKYNLFGDPTLRVGGLPNEGRPWSVPPLAEYDVPSGFELIGNYPNPFNAATVIQFRLDQPQRVNLTIYNVLGQVTGTLVNESLPAGVHRIRWRPEQIISSGLYFYSVSTEDRTEVRKLLYLK